MTSHEQVWMKGRHHHLSPFGTGECKYECLRDDSQADTCLLLNVTVMEGQDWTYGDFKIRANLVDYIFKDKE